MAAGDMLLEYSGSKSAHRIKFMTRSQTSHAANVVRDPPDHVVHKYKYKAKNKAMNPMEYPHDDDTGTAPLDRVTGKQKRTKASMKLLRNKIVEWTLGDVM